MSDLVTVFESGNQYTLPRSELIQNIEHKEKCDYSSSVLIKNFPEIKKFQKYVLGSGCHYRPVVNDEIVTSGDEVSKNILGEGSFGQVVKYGDSPIAIKVGKDSLRENYESLIEYNIMKNLLDSECCIVKAFDLNITKDNKVKIYLQEMSLNLWEYRTVKFDSVVARGEISKENLIKSILFDIFRGVYYTHSKGILHRDLKFENVLMTNNNAYITDWGTACFYRYIHHNQTFKSYIGTRSYHAPEMWNNEPYSFKLDVFALGVMATEMFEGNTHSITANYDRKKQKNPLGYVYDSEKNVILNKRYVTEGYDLFSRMMAFDQDKRPSMSEVLNDEYFKDIRNIKNNGKLFPSIDNLKVVGPDISHIGLQTDLQSIRSDLYKLYTNSDISSVSFHLACNLYIRYSNAKKMLGLKNLKQTAETCVAIANSFNDLRHNIVPPVETLKDIAETLNYDFYGDLPILYKEKWTVKEIETLLQIEFTATKKYDVQSIVDYVVFRKGKLSYDKTPIFEYFVEEVEDVDNTEIEAVDSEQLLLEQDERTDRLIMLQRELKKLQKGGKLSDFQKSEIANMKDFEGIRDTDEIIRIIPLVMLREQVEFDRIEKFLNGE